MRPTSAGPSPLLSLLTAPSNSSTTTLVHIKQTSLQSCAPLLSELVHSARERSERVIFLSDGQRQPPSFLTSNASSAVSVVTPDLYHEFGGREDGHRRHWHEVRRIAAEARQDRPITLIIESLDCLLDNVCESSDPARDVYRELQRTASALPPYSKLIFVTSSVGSSLQPTLQSHVLSLLSSSQFLKASQSTSLLPSPAGPSSARDTPSGAGSSAPLLTVQLHTPALWRRLLKEYGTSLRPASTTSQVASQLRSSYRKDSPDHLVILPTRLQRRDVSAARDRSASASASDLVDIFDGDARPTDPRLWPILTHLEATSDVTRGSTWFSDHDRDLAGEEIEAIRHTQGRDPDQATAMVTSPFDPIASRITLTDLLGPPTSGTSSKRSSQVQHSNASSASSTGATHRSRIGWGLITAHYRLPGGKFGQDIFGCVTRLEKQVHDGMTNVGGTKDGHALGQSSRLRLVPLEMRDRRAAIESSNKGAAAESSAAPVGKPPPRTGDHSSFVESLPFKLSLTEEQRLRRGNVELPFVPSDRIYEGISKEDTRTSGSEGKVGDAVDEEAMGLRRGTTGQSTIYFEPDSADEEDEEDPDEDLDF